MHHPIQMKPADTENRNGKFWSLTKFLFQIMFFFYTYKSFRKKREEALHWHDLAQLLRERHTRHVLPIRANRGLHGAARLEFKESWMRVRHVREAAVSHKRHQVDAPLTDHGGAFTLH
jgi:hypothetical protein